MYVEFEIQIDLFPTPHLPKKPSNIEILPYGLVLWKKNLQKSADNQTDNNGFPSVGIEIAVGY